jgi:hypothetical protein
MAGINFDRERLEKLGEALPILFFALVFIAFLCAVVGSPGSGLLVLILAGAAHVARVGIEGFLEPPAKPAQRPRPASRPRPARPPQRAVSSRSRG